MLDDLKVDTIQTSREGFKLAMEISAYSLIAVANAAQPILAPKASIVTMTYFGGEKAVPGYNVMGICKAALDSIVKYLAYDLGPRGVRVNAVSAGPVRTLAGRAAGVEDMLGLYEKMSPLGRNVTHEEVGRTGGFLLSDMSDGITGEILHLDCGYNIMGSPGRLLDAYRQGARSDRLTREPCNAVEPTQIAVAVVERDGQFLVGVRPPGVPLAGLLGISGRQSSRRRNAAGRRGARMPRRNRLAHRTVRRVSRRHPSIRSRLVATLFFRGAMRLGDRRTAAAFRVGAAAEASRIDVSASQCGTDRVLASSASRGRIGRPE